MNRQDAPVLEPQLASQFERDGLLVVRGFYDVRHDIEPIQRGIHRIIGQVMKRHGIEDRRRSFTPEAFDDGYLGLIALERAFGGEVYDAVKQLPAFIRLLGDQRHERLVMQLRPGAIPGIAAGGFGIRIDNPNEDLYRAEWHQEYPSQLRSLDGLVFWSPLRAVTAELGPVRLLPGSHRLGPVPVWSAAGGQKSGAYALRLKDEPELLSRFQEVAPLTSPGDLVVIDFLTLHASGFNRADLPRWSVQFRYFNFDEPTGLSHGWKGSFAAGVDFRRVHPELFADPPRDE